MQLGKDFEEFVDSPGPVVTDISPFRRNSVPMRAMLTHGQKWHTSLMLQMPARVLAPLSSHTSECCPDSAGCPFKIMTFNAYTDMHRCMAFPSGLCLTMQLGKDFEDFVDSPGPVVTDISPFRRNSVPMSRFRVEFSLRIVVLRSWQEHIFDHVCSPVSSPLSGASPDAWCCPFKIMTFNAYTDMHRCMAFPSGLCLTMQLGKDFEEFVDSPGPVVTDISPFRRNSVPMSSYINRNPIRLNAKERRQGLPKTPRGTPEAFPAGGHWRRSSWGPAESLAGPQRLGCPFKIMTFNAYTDMHRCMAFPSGLCLTMQLGKDFEEFVDSPGPVVTDISPFRRNSVPMRAMLTHGQKWHTSLMLQMPARVLAPLSSHTSECCPDSASRFRVEFSLRIVVLRSWQEHIFDHVCSPVSSSLSGASPDAWCLLVVHAYVLSTGEARHVAP
ncbi:hypothetical protein STEG23_008745 [Scotinomys teguina]